MIAVKENNFRWLSNEEKLKRQLEVEETVIHACKKGNVEVVDDFLKNGAKINDYLNSNWTLLHYASFYAQTCLIQRLLELKADPNKHYEGYTPLMALCNSSGNTEEKCLESLKILIAAKANTNATTKYRETPLMLSCKVQTLGFINELLKYTNDIDSSDHEGKTALFYAVLSNRPDLTKLLIENGADVSLLDSRGLTVYDVALTKNFKDILPLVKNNQDEVEEDYIETKYFSNWRDMFLRLSKKHPNSVSIDIEVMLHGMGLDYYKNCFVGMNIKSFLSLKEEDLIQLGININFHRKKFLHYMHKFHLYKWDEKTLGAVDITKKLTSFESIKALGNVNRQLIILNSDILYAKDLLNNLNEAEDRDIVQEKIVILENEAIEVKKTLNIIKNFAQKMQNDSLNFTLPIHIKKENKITKKRYIIILSTITIFGILIYKYKYCKL